MNFKCRLVYNFLIIFFKNDRVKKIENIGSRKYLFFRVVFFHICHSFPCENAENRNWSDIYKYIFYDGLKFRRHWHTASVIDKMRSFIFLTCNNFGQSFWTLCAKTYMSICTVYVSSCQSPEKITFFVGKTVLKCRS